ncbi:MAG: lipid-A-disaccharide synthase [Desulfovibrionaceae bacterium]|jgi:lipid-A-disaccharide synthase|nr:lipid-A-disaccharide synthase [Desulfovibrionaceae bacterium]
MERTLWINTGEPSGDLHGALLCRALLARAPDLRIAAMGGDELRAAGAEVAVDIERLSVMGFTEVLAKLPTILKLLSTIKAELVRRRPDAVILVDAPSFNFRVAKMAHGLGIPVHYYISPKLWAWNTGRVRFVRDHVRRMLCILPFEVEFYRRHGLDVDYVGNPLVDAVAEELEDAGRADWAGAPEEPGSGVVGVLPGSRRKEIEGLLPVFGEAARILTARLPSVRFEIVRAPSVREERLRELWPRDVEARILPPEGRYAAMRGWETALAASGTVTLETALLGVPTVVAYKLSALTFALARRFVRVEHVALPNLILGERLFPELLQHEATGPAVAAAAMKWLGDPALAAAVRARLADLRDILGAPGAPDRAAGIILGDL